MAFLVFPANNALAQFGVQKIFAKDVNFVGHVLELGGPVYEQGYEFYTGKNRRKVVAYFSASSIAGFVRVDD